MALLDKLRQSKELERFRQEMDDLLERFSFGRDWFRGFPFDREFFGGREPAPARPAVETRVEDGKLIIRTDLPGIDPKDIEIKVVGDVLTIRGQREDKRENSNADYFTREIRYGSFERSIPLPDGVKAEDLKASYRDGVLELTAPMPKEAAPKEVKIQVEGSDTGSEKKS